MRYCGKITSKICLILAAVVVPVGCSAAATAQRSPTEGVAVVGGANVVAPVKRGPRPLFSVRPLAEGERSATAR